MLTLHQNYVILIFAFLFSLLILPAAPIWHGTDLWLRMVYAAALFLLARDVIAGVSIARGPREFSNPNRWVYAFYNALYFGIFMLLFNWQGPENLPRLALVSAFGAVLFGAIMSFLYDGKTHEYEHHFDTQNPAVTSRFWTAVFYLWPVITLGVFICLLVLPPPRADLFFTVLLFTGFLMPRFSRLRKGNYVWTNLPRLVGFGLLCVIPAMTAYDDIKTRFTPVIAAPEASGPQPIYPDLSQ